MKGVLFSVIFTLLLIVILSMVLLQRENVSYERHNIFLAQEIQDLKHTYNSIERGIHILSDVAVKRAVISSLNIILDEGIFFEDNKTEENILELIWNGTLNGTNISGMGNNTLENSLAELERFYKDTKDYNLSITLKQSKISLDNSFYILFNATAEINISKKGLATISKETQIIEKVWIDDFEDPLYLINITEGKGSRRIKKSECIGDFSELILTGNNESGWCYGEVVITSNITLVLNKDKKIAVVGDATPYPHSEINQFCGIIYGSNFPANVTIPHLRNNTAVTILVNNSKVLLSGEQGKVWNISNFVEHVDKRRYINSSLGPSFFDRMEGKNYCSYCSINHSVGLESFVDKNELLSYGIGVEMDATNLEYLYTNITSGVDIGLDESNTGVTEFKYFRVDDGSIGRYFE
ncbi:MAG: hypothetical protein DRP06_03560 [Candidatus Aenigmatarchaeota archaeon]|nr:MAG: hypothetical protein DRP06_03560 [Candidatus Aenigmarchaeota archaeon]